MIGVTFEAVEEEIQAACRRAGRAREDVLLVAVTKTVSSDRINEALRAGITDIGENRVQEYIRKKPELLPHRFHMVGHLQTNKVRQVAGDVSLIHSVDSLRLAEEIERCAAQAGREVEILLEVNTSGEGSKFGLEPDAVRPLLEKVLDFDHLSLCGFMTVAAFETDPEKVRPNFILLRSLRDRAEAEFALSLPHLSMGMSNDFDVAIEEGATIIRIGTALFGARPPA